MWDVFVRRGTQFNLYIIIPLILDDYFVLAIGEYSF